MVNHVLNNVKDAKGARIVRKSGSPDFEVEIRASQVGGDVGLLIVTHGQFGRDGFEVTKEAACAAVGASGEIEFGAR
jgi:hypothetical protein